MCVCVCVCIVCTERVSASVVCVCVRACVLSVRKECPLAEAFALFKWQYDTSGHSVIVFKEL